MLTEVLQNVVDDIGRNDSKGVTKTSEIDEEDDDEISKTNDILLDAPIDDLQKVELSPNGRVSELEN